MINQFVCSENNKLTCNNNFEVLWILIYTVLFTKSIKSKKMNKPIEQAVKQTLKH